MTNEELKALDHAVAEARGWILREKGGLAPYWVTLTKHHIQFHCRVEDYTPTTNPAQWAELVDEIGKAKFVSLHNDGDQPNPYEFRIFNAVGYVDGIGPTPGVAVCRAVIALLGGE